MSRSQQEHKRRVLPLFKNIPRHHQAGWHPGQDTLGQQGAPLPIRSPAPRSDWRTPCSIQPITSEEHAVAAAMPAAAGSAAMPSTPSTSAAAATSEVNRKARVDKSLGSATSLSRFLECERARLSNLQDLGWERTDSSSLPTVM
jgi:hypothetical protein